MYVGYMYGSVGSLANNRNNTTNSTIKTVVDNWYKDNICGTVVDGKCTSSSSNLIDSNAIYCNERSGEGYASSGYMYYAAYNRLKSRKRPTYKCGGNSVGGYTNTSQTWVINTAEMYSDANIEDKFSKGTNLGGNGKLTYPVGLMTADEVAFAGGKDGSDAPNTYYYLNSIGKSVTGDQRWWTMSPSFTDSYAHVFHIGASDRPGLLIYGTSSDP